MIAMFSGMRLDEICQLHVEDILEIDGIPCFDINDRGEKKLKSRSSQRIIPVHPFLIQHGFLDYVGQAVTKDNQQVWKNLTKNKYGYWGKKLGNWYGRFNRKHITADPKKCFHSFRHTVADTMKQTGVQEGIIGEILGHSNESITTGRYGKKFRPAALSEAIKMLDYGPEHGP